MSKITCDHPEYDETLAAAKKTATNDIAFANLYIVLGLLGITILWIGVSVLGLFGVTWAADLMYDNLWMVTFLALINAISASIEKSGQEVWQQMRYARFMGRLDFGYFAYPLIMMVYMHKAPVYFGIMLFLSVLLVYGTAKRLSAQEGVLEEITDKVDAQEDATKSDIK
jgi:hypothetical protein